MGLSPSSNLLRGKRAECPDQLPTWWTGESERRAGALRSVVCVHAVPQHGDSLFSVRSRGSWVRRCSQGPLWNRRSHLDQSWEPGSSEPEAEICVESRQQRGPVLSQLMLDSLFSYRNGIFGESLPEPSVPHVRTHDGHSWSPTRGGLVLQSENLSRYMECSQMPVQ